MASNFDILLTVGSMDDVPHTTIGSAVKVLGGVSFLTAGRTSGFERYPTKPTPKARSQSGPQKRNDVPKDKSVGGRIPSEFQVAKNLG